MNNVIATLIIVLSIVPLSGRSVIRYRPADDIDRRLGRWRYVVRVTARGTRSEGTHGRLYWKGQRIPDRFHEVRINMGKFVFYRSRHRWGAHGWKQESRTPVSSLGQVRKVLGRTARIRGWYRDRMQRIHTPPSWIRVRRGREYFWAAPGKLARLARKQGWSRLHPYGYRRFKK